MTQIAVKSVLPDDHWMARRPKSVYVPPKDSRAIPLSQALANTGRLPDSKQLDLLGGSKSAGDQLLFYSGDVSLLTRPCVSIVGTRDVSESGIGATKWLAHKLVDAGIVVVSGLAYGVDTVAHSETIAHGGKTIAVIGTPIDIASPPFARCTFQGR